MKRTSSLALFVALTLMTVAGAALLSVGLPFDGVSAPGLARPHLAPVEGRNHLDHSGLMPGPFADGPSVTRACLTCHVKAAREVMKTSHYTWLGEEVLVPGGPGPAHEVPTRIGKKNLLNNFCLSVESNWDRCTSCHAGYGWKDASFAFDDESTVDCLVCHDQSGTYKKAGAGLPAEGVDLVAAAASVGFATRDNCGSCHFSGGGGDAVKHGDLDGTLAFPGRHVDVHMGQEDMRCTQCHETSHHQISGRSLSVSTGVEPGGRIDCEGCHTKTPHEDSRINLHTDSVACSTCHIPLLAIDTPTKMIWDWSTAGQDVEEPDSHTYLKEKGSFVYEKRVVPEYLWFDGTVTRYLKGDVIDPSKPVPINAPRGSVRDPRARLHPFKVHRGKQPYDSERLILLVAHTTGAEGYWKTYDWRSALEAGAKAAGLPFSGNYDFAPTEMYWPLSHMVRPGKEALSCVDCHGPNGRMDWTQLGYEGDPAYRGGRVRQGLVNADAGPPAPAALGREP